MEEAAVREGKHLDESGGLVEGHLSGGDVQSEPGRLLPLQAAGALPLWFSHVLCPTPGLPATRRQEGELVICHHIKRLHISLRCTNTKTFH